MNLHDRQSYNIFHKETQNKYSVLHATFRILRISYSYDLCLVYMGLHFYMYITRSLIICTLKWLGLFFKWHSLRIMNYKLRRVMAQNDTKNTKNWEDVCWAGDGRDISQMNSWQNTACSEIGFEILDWILCRWTDW